MSDVQSPNAHILGVGHNGWPRKWRNVRATFRPTRTDDLKRGLAALVGEVFEWRYAGFMDEGRYAGQWIWTTDDRRLAWWVPDEDLEIVQEAKDE